MDTKACSKCKEVKPLLGFYYDKRKADKRHPECKSCFNERMKATRKTLAFKIRYNPYQKIWQRTYRQTAKYKAWRKEAGERLKIKRNALKLQIVEHYGRVCKCCRISDIRFLTIDHINNDGYKLRKENKCRSYGYHYYQKIVADNFPNNLQILCYNCNIARQHNGGVCPHIQ